MFSSGFDRSLSERFTTQQDGSHAILLYDSEKPASVDDVVFKTLSEALESASAVAYASISRTAPNSCTLSQIGSAGLSKFTERTFVSNDDSNGTAVFVKKPTYITSYLRPEGPTNAQLISLRLYGGEYIQSVTGVRSWGEGRSLEYVYDDAILFDGLFIHSKDFNSRSSYLTDIYVYARDSDDDVWVLQQVFRDGQIQGKKYAVFTSPFTAKQIKFSIVAYDFDNRYNSNDHTADVYSIIPYTSARPTSMDTESVDPKWGIMVYPPSISGSYSSELRTEIKSMLLDVGLTGSNAALRFPSLPLSGTDSDVFETRQIVFGELFNTWNDPRS